MTDIALTPPAGAAPPADPGDTTGSNGVQKVRTWAGLLAVVVGDLVIAAAVVIALIKLSPDSSQVVAILTAGFTALSTMTTAYFGIRAATNSAQAAMEKILK